MLMMLFQTVLNRLCGRLVSNCACGLQSNGNSTRAASGIHGAKLQNHFEQKETDLNG